MQRIVKFFKHGISRLSNATKGIVTIMARLFGIRAKKDGKYDSTQLSSAVWIFALGIPAGLFIAGMDFPIMLWAAIVFGTLALVNLDEALMLTVIYAEHGVKKAGTTND
jgi:hypothetical protein